MTAGTGPFDRRRHYVGQGPYRDLPVADVSVGQPRRGQAEERAAAPGTEAPGWEGELWGRFLRKRVSKRPEAAGSSGGSKPAVSAHRQTCGCTGLHVRNKSACRGERTTQTAAALCCSTEDADTVVRQAGRKAFRKKRTKREVQRAVRFPVASQRAADGVSCGQVSPDGAQHSGWHCSERKCLKRTVRCEVTVYMERLMCCMVLF